MNTRIELIEQVIAYEDPKNRWIKLYFDKVKFPDGEIGFHNRIIESNGKPGVVILPLRNDEIGMVRQYRYPIDAEVWELPRGYGESENAVTDAVRELSEETGIIVEQSQIIELGYIYPNSGILAAKVYLYLVNCDEKTKVGLKSDKYLEFAWKNIKDVLKAIREGEVNDAFTICANITGSVNKSPTD